LISSGVYAARTLVACDRCVDIPVRVVNVQPTSVRIPVGTTISQLQPVLVMNSGKIRSVDVRGRHEEATEETMSDGGVPEFVDILVGGIHHTVPEASAVKLREVLTCYSDVFSQSERDLGLTGIVSHHIDTGTAKPLRQRLRRFTPAHVEAISNHVDDMLSQGVIEPANSPWASNVVLVRKKDGTYRCSIDYRQLNSVTRRDAYPLPRIDTCLDAMSEGKWFSTFDLRSSYHQVPVDSNDTDKTAFICPRRMFKLRTMPFGLCNAGATFQRLMDIVMTGLNLEVCLVYLDDIIVYSRTIDKHMERLIAVLTRLRHAGLKLKPEKCALLQKSVSFLGHVISDEGIGTDPDKIRAVMEWPSLLASKIFVPSLAMVATTAGP